MTNNSGNSESSPSSPIGHDGQSGNATPDNSGKPIESGGPHPGNAVDGPPLKFDWHNTPAGAVTPPIPWTGAAATPMTAPIAYQSTTGAALTPPIPYTGINGNAS